MRNTSPFNQRERTNLRGTSPAVFQRQQIQSPRGHNHEHFDHSFFSLSRKQDIKHKDDCKNHPVNKTAFELRRNSSCTQLNDRRNRAFSDAEQLSNDSHCSCVTMEEPGFLLSPALIMTSSQPYLNMDQVSVAVEMEHIKEHEHHLDHYHSHTYFIKNADLVNFSGSQSTRTRDPQKSFDCCGQSRAAALEKKKNQSLWALLGVLVLVSAIIGGSCIGTVSNFIPPKNSLVLNSWRYGILVLYMAIPTLIETIYQWSHFKFRDIFSLKNYSFLILTQLMQIAWTCGLLYGSGQMIQSHVYVLNNTHGLFIVLLGVMLGQSLYKSEGIGILLSLIGVVCMLVDPSALRVDGKQGTYTDYGLVLLSAVFGAFYFHMNAKNVKDMPICMLLFTMNVHNFFLCSALAILTSDKVKVFSLDVENGCLGFLNPEVMFVALVPYGILAAFFGSAGYVLCLLFYSPVVTSNSYLIEPFIAQALGFMFGVDRIPGLMTLLGTLFAIAGIWYLQKGNNEKQAQKLDIEAENYQLQDNKSVSLSDISRMKRKLSC